MAPHAHYRVALIVMRVAVILPFLCQIAGAQEETKVAPGISVRGSIEMRVFSDPEARSPEVDCSLSPNGKYWLSVTTQGIIAKNMLRSTIWLFDHDAIGHYLLTRTANRPSPVALVTREVVPRAAQVGWSGSVIVKVQWSSDSKSILFLGETVGGIRSLYSVSLVTHQLRRLTPSGQDVDGFAERSGTIVYIATPILKRGKSNFLVDKGQGDEQVLTSLTMFNLIAPERWENGALLNNSKDIWVIRHSESYRVNPTRGPDGWHFPWSASSLRLALSPAGDHLICARPISNIKPEWNSYKSARPSFSFGALVRKDTAEDVSLDSPWEYIFVDIRDGKTLPITDAPNATVAGYYNTNMAVWSEDAEHAIITNTFLATAPRSSTVRGVPSMPCLAAVFNVKLASTVCVRIADDPTGGDRLISASFGISPQEVVLRMQKANKKFIERYKIQSARWMRVADLEPVQSERSALGLYLQQDISQRPTLWATNIANGIRREIWDPNQNLQNTNVGDASVVRWKDSTGYEWRAGLVMPLGYVPGHRYPLVIQTHGFYNEHEFLLDGSYTSGFAARPLATAGIMVLQMEDRGDRNNHPMKDEADLAVLGFTSAIDMLDRKGLIDTHNVGIIGFSRTSWHVENALISFPQLFRAATLVDGVDQSYMTYMLFCPGFSECQREHEAINGGPPLGKNLQQWITEAASFKLDKVVTPIRIEAIGPISLLGEWEIYASLTLQAKPVDLLYLTGYNHVLQQPRQRFASQQGDVDWFRFWLQNFEDPDPKKRGQYERWRKLRLQSKDRLSG